jgi:hypothetical protein
MHSWGKTWTEWALSSAFWGSVFLHPAWFLLWTPLFGGLWQTVAFVAVAAVVAICLCLSLDLSLITHAQKMHPWGEIILNTLNEILLHTLNEIFLDRPFSSLSFWTLHGFDSNLMSSFFWVNSTRCCRVFRAPQSQWGGECWWTRVGLELSLRLLGIPTWFFLRIPTWFFLALNYQHYWQWKWSMSIH